jgi:hypothetical protein
MKNKVLKIYVSGKITGEPNHKEKFELASFFLLLRGFEPVNPVEFCSDLSDRNWSNCMQKCLRVLLDCDGIFLLRDWDYSRGATVEKQFAEIIKKVKPEFEIIEQK